MLNSELKQSEYNVTAGMPISRDRLLEGLVTGSIDESMLEKYRELYGLDFPWKTYHVGLVDAGSGAADDEQVDSIKGLVRSYVCDNFYGYVFFVSGYIGILFRNISLLSIPRILRVLQDKVRSSFGITVTISMGSSVDALNLIPGSYLHAYRLLEQKFLYGHKQLVIRIEEGSGVCDAEAAEPMDINLGRLPEDLYHAMDSGNIVAVNNILEETKNWQIRHMLAEGAIRQNYVKLYLAVLNWLDAGGESAGVFSNEKQAVQAEINEKASLQELHGFMKFKLLSISESMTHSNPESLTERVKNYIDRNYQGEIRLENLAFLFNYNSTYLGKLFKSRTGQYFNTYLDQVRIEKAKLLLKEGFKVYQVVERVGINDTDYFHKKFKKYTGLSPTAFKGKGQ